MKTSVEAKIKNEIVRHIVCFKFKETANLNQINQIEKEFSALPHKIPGIISMEWGKNNSQEGLHKDFTHCFIVSFENYEESNRKYLLLSLKYTGKSRNSVISEIKRVSKPGLRVYANSKELPRVLDNLGIAIMSTSRGVMTNLKAKELGIGGEVLCYIW